jgi:hypothetical protein
MSSEAGSFRCVFGVTGHRADGLRLFAFDPIDVELLCAQLERFAPHPLARTGRSLTLRDDRGMKRRHRPRDVRPVQ